MRYAPFVLLLGGAVCAQTVADPKPLEMIETGLSPQEALERMTVPEGFAVELLVAEPDLTQPIAMCFDERGRIWVAEGHTYPRRAEEGQGKDRIVIFEDGDGDGSFETRKVFAEKLNLVSGLEVGFGGVYVGAPPWLLFIPDRDRDDVPDGEPEVLLDGWGYQDTHETLNSFTWGPDGWLYGCHGVFTHSNVGKPGTPDAERVPINAGVWRFHPVRRDFEVFAHGTSNPWGVDFNDKGQCFIEACVIPHFWHMIQGGLYQRQGGQHFNPYFYTEIGTIADHAHYVGNIGDHAHWGHEKTIATDVSAAGGGHAHCGLSIYLGDNFPDEYRNQPLFFNVHGHRINRETLTRRGSGWKASHAPDFLETHDKWFMGVALDYGPDGALYLIDWYDQTNCHRREVERWDRSNGRMYRVSYEGWKPVTVDLWEKSSLELAKLQTHRNEWYARTARRLLQERVASGKELGEEAREFLNDVLKEHEDEATRLRALWCLWACGELDFFELPLPAMDKSEWMRAWAVQLMCEGPEVYGSHQDMVKGMARSEKSPVVKLYLASAAQRLPNEARWEIVSALVANTGPDDHNLPQMIWYGLEPLVEDDPDRALKIALSSPLPRLAEFVVRRMRGEDWIDVVFAALRDSATSEEGQARLLDGLLVRFEQEKKLPLEAKHGVILVALKESDSEHVKRAAGRLAALAGDAASLEAMWAQFENAQADLAARRAALSALVSAGKEAHRERLSKQLETPELALEVLKHYPHAIAQRDVFARFDAFTRNQQLTLMELSLEHGLHQVLMTAVNAGQVTVGQVPPHLVWRMRQIRENSVQAFVTKHWREANEGDKAAMAQIASWKEKLSSGPVGDPAQGRNEYRNLCGTCHKLFGDGNEVGPDLTGANRQSLDYLLENILNPNALVGEGYELHSLTMKDGGVKVGMLAREDDTVLVLRGAGGDENVVRKDAVAGRDKLGISLMPPGLLSALSEGQVRDLIAYLQSPRQVALPPKP